jgi:hypothetical protein
MIDLGRLFDPYSRQARLFPGLLTIFPILLTAVAWYPSLITGSIGGTLLTIATSCGLLYALSVLSRSRGKAVERRLLKEWGGWPTTIWLRHCDTHLPDAVRLRYHAFLASHVPGLVLPTREQEEQDPAQADGAYASAVKWLQERCRGKAFPFVEKENAEYGFRRNLRGLKPIGIICCAAALAVSTFAIGRSQPALIVALVALSPAEAIDALASANPAAVGATLADLVALAGWLLLVTDVWVREAGDQFARALLANCDILGSEPAKANTRVKRSGKPAPEG